MPLRLASSTDKCWESVPMLILTFPWNNLPDCLPLAANESLQGVG
ncbi:MAG: hypothetical protein ACKN9U_18835 [Pirellulaceae bacterium]